MFEAVGSEYWNSYFQKIQNVLKPNAKAVIQTITMTEDYFEGYDKWPDFIQTYIFPGGELASDQLFIDEANKFDLENIKTTNFAKSYAKTLETWYENFQIAWSDIEKMGGGFGGYGQEIIFRNDLSFYHPNDANTSWHSFMRTGRFGDTGAVCFPKGLGFGSDTATANVIDD